ncbi:MAG: aspartyl-phosphate phosphatase Spo0E family protein [Clostridiaceae bacterium]|nr:aspartyl-phosphate phosphatase Spo0E family protein [Clostridiaceae bacterium]
MRYEYMNIKSYVVKNYLESLRIILHLLLNFKKPTDKIVVSCSQQLDDVIVKYHKIQAALKKAA